MVAPPAVSANADGGGAAPDEPMTAAMALHLTREFVLLSALLEPKELARLLADVIRARAKKVEAA